MGLALATSVALPWFGLPLAGKVLPWPAWNLLGLGLLVLAGAHLWRALSFPGAAWAIRLLLPGVLWGWWHSPERFRLWGMAVLAPWQLQLDGVNQVLARLGQAPLTLFDPVVWRDISLGWGYRLAGGCLVLSALLTVCDFGLRPRCLGCRAQVGVRDRFCFQCGDGLSGDGGCGQCGEPGRSGDQFCRACGAARAAVR